MSCYPLNFPKPARFSTDLDNTVEPNEGEKDTGLLIDDFVPSGWLNWALNLSHEYQKLLIGNILGKWSWKETRNSDLDFYNIGFHENQRKWLQLAYDPTPTFEIATYHNVIPQTLADTSYAWPAATIASLLSKDTTRFIAANFISGSHQLIYSSDLSGWTIYDTGQNAGISCVGTKYPLEDDDFIICAWSGGFIKRANSITGLSAAGLENSGVGEAFRRLLYLGNENWLLIDDGLFNALRYSIDDGESWMLSPGQPSVLTAGGNGLDINPDSGVVICGGGGSAHIERSPDQGMSWESVSFEIGGRTHSTIRKVLYLGGGAWVAVGDEMHTTIGAANEYHPGILISVDDGKTWCCPGFEKTNALDPYGDYDNNIIDVECDGKCLTAITASGQLYITDSIVGVL